MLTRVCVLLLVWALPATALANDSIFGGCGAAMAPVDGLKTCVPVANAHIAMADEVLTFVQHRGSWRVKATYIFHNTGPKATLTVGFPLNAPNVLIEEDTAKATKKMVRSYKVSVDGRKARARLFQVGDKGAVEKTAATQAAEKYGYDLVMLTRVTFAAGQRRTLEHRFEQGESGNSLGQSSLHYLLRTGGLWRGGRIGRIRVSIRFEQPIAYECHGFSFAGARWDAASRTLSWEAKAFAPVHDLQATYSNSIDVVPLRMMEVADVTSNATVAEIRAELKDLSTKNLSKTYAGVLQLFRYSDPSAKAQNADMCDGADIGEGDKLHLIASVRDPSPKRSYFGRDLGRWMTEIHAELTRRKDPKPAALPPK